MRTNDHDVTTNLTLPLNGVSRVIGVQTYYGIVPLCRVAASTGPSTTGGQHSEQQLYYGAHGT